jgi:hypothetical protein
VKDDRQGAEENVHLCPNDVGSSPPPPGIIILNNILVRY